MQGISIHKRFLSYFYPVRIRYATGAVNPFLELYLYKGQVQLATLDALYSDGDRYRPVIAAFKEIKAALPAIKTVLVLGTGLGSTVRIMNKQGYYPYFTLVDNDKVVLQWALEFLENKTAGKIKTVCADAKEFIVAGNEKYDLVVVDIFSGRVVPDFVTSSVFLSQCSSRVAAGGFLMLNYIINNKENWEQTKDTMSRLFPGSRLIDLGVNRVFVIKV
jgi:spermidine synthase